jgi:hypothetical protein
METSVIWAFYYAAHIVLARSHPHMPPMVMMAAGAAATQTAEHAARIGRIAAGMMPLAITPPANPQLTASLAEVTIPLFIVGVQLHDATQRAWLVDRLRALDGATGWKSIGFIAAGCETAWERAAAAGHGPPYLRTTERQVVVPVPVPPDGVEPLWAQAADGGVALDEDDRRVKLAAGLIGDIVN